MMTSDREFNASLGASAAALLIAIPLCLLAYPAFTEPENKGKESVSTLEYDEWREVNDEPCCHVLIVKGEWSHCETGAIERNIETSRVLWDKQHPVHDSWGRLKRLGACWYYDPPRGQK